MDKQRIIDRLEALGVPIQHSEISREAFQKYLGMATYPAGYYKGSEYLSEKQLEHFVASRLLDIGPGVYLDVGSCQSPAPEIYRELFGCESLKQDLTYPSGIHGDTIGSLAGDIPLEDGSVDWITLHCTFEHFEGNQDSLFIREAERLLSPGGKLCILPLYLSADFQIIYDPSVRDPQTLDLQGALAVPKPGWANTHGRFYSPEELIGRVLSQTSLRSKVFVFDNLGEFKQPCYLEYALLMTKGVPCAH